MLINKRGKCTKCGKGDIFVSPYNTFECKRCNRIHFLCAVCINDVRCSCGAKMISDHEQSAKELGINPNNLLY